MKPPLFVPGDYVSCNEKAIKTFGRNLKLGSVFVMQILRNVTHEWHSVYHIYDVKFIYESKPIWYSITNRNKNEIAQWAEFYLTEYCGDINPKLFDLTNI